MSSYIYVFHQVPILGEYYCISRPSQDFLPVAQSRSYNGHVTSPQNELSSREHGLADIFQDYPFQMSQKAYQSIMDANIQATQYLQESQLQKGYQILKKIETSLQQERNAPSIPLSQINHLLSVVTNNLGCYFYMVEKYNAAEKYLKLSIKYLSQSIHDETLLITLINLVILFIKNEKYREASAYIEQSFSELSQIQDQQLNPKIRLFLGDQQSVMTLQSLEAILLFYSGMAFQNLDETANALQAWRKALEMLRGNQKSPYYILTKSKIQNLEAEETAHRAKTSRQHLKSDRISKILQAYQHESKNSQESFRTLSQKIKRKIGNQLSEHQNPSWYQQQNQSKIEHNEKKIEINNYFTDHKRVELQINVKDLLQHKNITQREKIIKKRPTQHLEIMEKLNKTHNEIYKTYLAQRNNGSKTQRGDSRDLDIRIKVNDKSTQSALLQTLINKSNEKRSVEARESPEQCFSPQQFYQMIQKSSGTSLLRSGSQGTIQGQSPQKPVSKKQQSEQPKTHRPIGDAYNQTLKILQEKDRQKEQQSKRVKSLVSSALNRIEIVKEILERQEKIRQQIQQEMEELQQRYPEEESEEL